MNETSEVTAILSFVEYFVKTYKRNLPTLPICTLKDAIAKSCSSEIKEQKVLLLYFHNESDGFSKMFCECLLNDEVRTIIEQRCFFLAWDVQKAEYHKSLIYSVNTNLNPLLEKFIEKKRSGLFTIFSIANIPSVFSFLHGDVKEKDLLSLLKQCIKSFEEECDTDSKLKDIEKEHSTKNDFTSREFQQLMFNQLGDRDYDRFEANEHEFLKDKIGFSLYGPPQKETGYENKQKEHIEKTYEKIISCNDEISKWKNNVVISFIYVCTEPLPEEKIRKATECKNYNPNTDLVPIPLYVLRKCKNCNNPCRIFIDAFDLRVYESWNDYITNNELYKCQMVLPKNGRYCGDAKGNVLLEKHLSPACGIDKLLLKGADITSTAAGLFSGGVFAAAMIPAITVAPIVLTTAAFTGVAVGTYSILRSSLTLFDRYKHKQDVTLSNSEARGAYINIVAGSLGFVGAGANLAVSQLVSKGVPIGKGAIFTVDMINIANISAGGAGIVNAGYEVYDQWINNNTAPSLLTVVQLSSSILFFGNAVYNFRTTTTIIEETQTNTLRDIQDSLRSNRHRRTFRKLLKETIRQNGDTHTGRAEVISVIHNMNKDEVLGILTRSNKMFNKGSIRFAVKDGKITLNGVPVNIQEFGSLSRDQSLLVLLDLPGIPATPETINTVHLQVKQVFNITTLDSLLMFNRRVIRNGCTFAAIATTLLHRYKDDVKESIFCILKEVLNEFCKERFNFFEVLTTLPRINSVEPLIIVLKFILKFLRSKVYKLDEEYQKRKREVQKLPDFDEEKFNSEYWVTPSTAKNAMYFFEMVVNAYVNGTSLIDVSLKELIDYCMNRFAYLIYNYAESEKKKADRIRSPLIEQKCTICGGHYYT